MNVVVGRPSRCLRGFSRRIEACAHADGGYLRAMLKADPARDPLVQLHEDLEISLGHAERLAFRRLYRQLEPGAIVLVTDVTQKQWSRWQALLLQLDHETRNLAACERPLFVMEAVGVPKAALQALVATAIDVMVWDDVVSELDMLVFAESFSERSGGMARRIRIRTIAKLAAWDFQVAQELAHCGADFTRPLQVLKEIATAPGADVPAESSWECGGQARVDGIEVVHPLLVAAGGDRREDLRMRVWAAHAAEVLPRVEIVRRRLLPQLKSVFRVPFRLGDEEVRDIADLEIGQLCHLARTRRLSGILREDLEYWSAVRNKLAHLDPLSAADLSGAAGALD